MVYGEEFSSFWSDYLCSGDKKILFIMGRGFDTRMNRIISEIKPLQNRSSLEYLMIVFEEGPDSPSQRYTDQVKKNEDELQTIVGDEATTYIININTMEDERRVDGRKATEALNAHLDDSYTDIILDISALPKSIYIPVLKLLRGRCCEFNTNASERTNLHVVVSENLAVERKICEQGLDERAAYMHLFAADMQLTIAKDKPIVWFPLLGEGKTEHIKKIHDLLLSTTETMEICPILPFPSTNPRRADMLIEEYSDFLYRDIPGEARNIIYADEQNPLDVYTKIIESARLYDEALESLNGCNKVVSTLSSKLLSLGAALVAIETNMAIAYVGVQGYEILSSESDERATDDETVLYSLWIEGTPYDD